MEWHEVRFEKEEGKDRKDDQVFDEYTYKERQGRGFKGDKL